MVDEIVIDADLKSVIRSHNQPQQMRFLVLENFLHYLPSFPFNFLTMFLLHFTCFGVFVSEDEVELGVRPAFVWTEHDRVGSLICDGPQIQPRGL